MLEASQTVCKNGEKFKTDIWVEGKFYLFSLLLYMNICLNLPYIRYFIISYLIELQIFLQESTIENFQYFGFEKKTL